MTVIFIIHVFFLSITDLCSPLTLSNDEVTYTSSLVDGGYLPGTNATISCGDGWVVGGAEPVPGMETITCLDSGDWS